jgi:peptide alpha-N-acetyltransferase
MLLVESGQHQAALDHLRKFENQIVDRVSYLEVKGDILISLKRLYQASLVYKELLERNPENFFYFKRLEETRRPATVEERLKICTEVADQNRFASVARRLPLSFLTGKHFELALDSYMRRMLMKGTAPLFKLLKNLYSDKEKVKSIIIDYYC